MYDRYTDRARKVMLLANEHAIRMGGELIATEHYLFALIDEGSGVAAHVLTHLDVDVAEIRREVEKRSFNAPRTSPIERICFFTPAVVKLHQHARDEARELFHHYVGTEHLLLGMLRDPESMMPCAVMQQLGVSPATVRNDVLDILEHRLSP